MRLIAFCEAPADFRIASDLVDRVLREDGPSWVADVLDGAPEGIRSWHEDGKGRPFFDIHKVREYASRLSVRVPHGHFRGEPGAAGATMARTVFSIVRRLMKNGDGVDATVLVWDLDDEPEERRTGLAQARHEAQTWATFGIVIGCPNAKREAWVLTGFDPLTDDERARLAELRSELGFAPNHDAHLLDATDDLAKRSAKRVLQILTAGDREREERCWTETPLSTLRDRSGSTGLGEYLGEIKAHLVPLCRGSS